MNVLNISPTKKKIRYNKTVAFFPIYHPNKDLLIRRFSEAYHGPFLIRFLHREELPKEEFHKGWTIVIVGKILDSSNQRKLTDFTVLPPLYVYFKDWENPTFKRIEDPWANLVTPIKFDPLPKILPVEPDAIVVTDTVKEVVEPPTKPQVKQKERRPISANAKKEVVSVALRKSNKLADVEDKDILYAIARCKSLYNFPRIRQRNLVRHILIDVFGQSNLRDADIEFVNTHVVARVTAIKGVSYDKALGGFQVNDNILPKVTELGSA